MELLISFHIIQNTYNNIGMNNFAEQAKIQSKLQRYIQLLMFPSVVFRWPL